MDGGDCSYKLITENIYLKLRQNIYTKVYHIICSLRRSTYVEFNKIRFSILWFFGNLLWFFKDIVKIKIKEKEKNRCHLSLKPLREVMWTVSWVWEGWTDGFVVQKEKKRFSPKLREAKKTFSDWECLLFLKFFMRLRPRLVSKFFHALQ